MKLDMMKVSKDSYAQLLQDSYLLECLRNVGVESWDGYEKAKHIASGWVAPQDKSEI